VDPEDYTSLARHKWCAARQGNRVKVLTNIFGGQGTTNVPLWSPDSKNIAFVSYRLVGKEAGYSRRLERN
jgi:hypothetical protein